MSPPTLVSAVVVDCNSSCPDRSSSVTSSSTLSTSISSSSTHTTAAIVGIAEALDGVDMPMFAVNETGEVTAWNRKMQQVSGLSAALVCRRDLSELVVPEAAASTDHAGVLFWEQALRNAWCGTQGENCCCTIQLRSPPPTDADAVPAYSSPRCSFGVRISLNRAPTGESLGAVCFVLHCNDLSAKVDETEHRLTPPMVTIPKIAQRPPVTTTPVAESTASSASTTRELRQLISTASWPIFGLDTGGCINEWNDKMLEITGVCKVEATNKSFVEEFVAPSCQEAFQDVLSSAFKTGRGNSQFALQLVVATKKTNGTTRHLLVSTTPRRDANNDAVITGVICFAHDVTETSNCHRAVEVRACELRQLIDTANAPIFCVNLSGDITEWNEATAKITGFAKEEAMDCSFVEKIVAPHMRESGQAMLATCLEGRNSSNFELDFCTKSHDIRHLSVNATARRDAENSVVGVIAVAQDVTETVWRDRAVAGMALELRQLIDTANTPIFGCDVDFNVNEWNRRMEEITGILKEEAFGAPLVESFIAPSIHDKVMEILDAALHGNETSNYELEFRSKYDEPRFMLVNATTRRDPEGNIVGVFGVAQDVTEDRKRAAELRKMQYLQATQEAKVETERNMTAYFAHELRNPLSAIDSALSSMPDDLPESAQSLITGMQLCSRFMSAIMNNLLDVRKMEEGKMILTKAPLSLRTLLSGVHGMLRSSVKAGVAFNAAYHTDGRDWVLGDEHRIQQMLTNVVTNAIKYTLAGSIAMTIGWENGMVKFTCADTGPGIPKSAQQNMFQRFAQRGGAPGTGLGLAIAKHLVDLAGGTITLESDPAAGTTCVIHIPLAVCESPNTICLDDRSDRVLEAPLRFLIIDDVKINRMMLRRRIQKSICPLSTIAEAPTGELALEICGKEKFDVIIVDQYMEEAGGVMLGTDVVYAMRRMRIDSIIIGCSGNDLDAEFGEAGVDWVWQKPMPSNDEIIAQVRAALAVKHNL